MSNANVYANRILQSATSTPAAKKAIIVIDTFCEDKIDCEQHFRGIFIEFEQKSIYRPALLFMKCVQF